MYLAEIHGKISAENENKEDILTSNVFSFFKYADRKIFLWNFLRMVGLNVSLEQALHSEFLFWPSYTDGTQPDLVIITGPYYLLIEAKYHSGFGKATPIRKHQLVREIERGIFEAINLNKQFKILTITADSCRKLETKQEDISFQIIDWINWQKIAFLIYSILEQDQNISLETKFFAEDLYGLLVKKKLRNFEGIKVFDHVGKLSNVHETIFFQASTASYRGDFLGFLSVMEIMPNIPPAQKTLFYIAQKRFFESSISMNVMLTGSKDTLFFKSR